MLRGRVFPLRDSNHAPGIALVTWTVVALNLAVVAFQVATGGAFSDGVTLAAGLIPARLFGEGSAPEVVPAPLTLFTSMFLHGGWLHLAGNLWFLHVFGDNVEARLGSLGYAVFYLAAGLAAAVGQIAVDPWSPIPMVGASGAISGVIGAYVVFFPRARITTLVILGFFIRLVDLPAWVFVGVWFAMQLLGLFGGEQGTAWMAHIGGLVAGVVVAGVAEGLRAARASGRRPRRNR